MSSSTTSTPRRSARIQTKPGSSLSGFGQSFDSSVRSSPISINSVRKSHRRTRSIDASSPKSSLTVCLRVRPLLGSETATDPPMQFNSDSVVAPSSTGVKTYSFNNVFGPASTQDDIFKNVGLPAVKHIVSGNNAFIFAYGVTNSGKTYTVFGDNAHSETQGLLPRILDSVLNATHDMEGAHVELGMVEVYNENVYDLLAPRETRPDGKKQRQTLQIVEDSTGRTSVTVRGLLMHKVVTSADGQKLVRKGCRHRQVGQTRANSDSSRSHAVIVVRVLKAASSSSSSEAAGLSHVAMVSVTAGMKPAKDTESQQLEVFGELMIVDMAGSERTSKTNAVGTRLQEAANINTSLLTFSRCINALLQIQQSPSTPVLPPFRESKLTRLVQDAFIDPHAATTLIVNASPSAGDWKETANSLQFGSIAQEIVRDDSWLLMSGSKRRRTAASSSSTATVSALQEQLKSVQEQCDQEQSAWAQREAELKARIEELEKENAELREELEYSRNYFQDFIQKLGDERTAELLAMPLKPKSVTTITTTSTSTPSQDQDQGQTQGHDQVESDDS